jgi:hypothetical protein
VTDKYGNTHLSLSEITATFVSHMIHKYKPIAVDETAIATCRPFYTQCARRRMPSNWNNLLGMTSCSRRCVPVHIVNRLESTACLLNSIRPTGKRSVRSCYNFLTICS